MTLDNFKKTKLPETPGVYFFLNKQKKILYIGKATSLRDRVRSYFSNDLLVTRGPLLIKMIEEATHIDFKVTNSVLEALLVEVDLIKKFKPDFNTKEKDDKSFNCVVFTEEDFPQLLIVRKKDINFDSLSTINYQLRTIFGPFPNSMQLKEALKILRKIFPYRDNKCKLNSKRPCFNYAIGLCPGTCIGVIDKKCYEKRVKRIEKFLSGDFESIVKELEKEMKSLAKEKKFEAASILRDKVYALTHIQDVSLIKQDSTKPGQHVFRIESYDIAHMAGKNMVGVMTVVENGLAEKSQYRKFKVNTVSASNDTKALAEIVKRRLVHTEWQMPNLIVVDGGIAQLNIVKLTLKNSGISIPVVSVVKDVHHKPKDILGEEAFATKYKKEILLSNAEAHRFAIGYHKKLRRNNFLPRN